MIDKGWIRILGSGSEKLNRGLGEWNKGKTFKNYGDQPTHFLIADDIIGGYFALNAGGIGRELGKVYYLPQDTLKWECLDIGYSEFLYWALTGDVHGFYELFRWKNWERDIQTANGNQVFSFVPFLWTEEGKDIENTCRSLVPVEENYHLTLDFQQQFDVNHIARLDVRLCWFGWFRSNVFYVQPHQYRNKKRYDPDQADHASQGHERYADADGVG